MGDPAGSANDFLVIEDSAAEEAQRRARSDNDLMRSRPSVSALAGLAALQIVTSDPMTRELLELVPSSRVLVIGTDGEPAVAAAARSAAVRATRSASKAPSRRTVRKGRRKA